MSDQLNLFNGHSLNPVPQVKEAMRNAIKASGKSREQVVDEMNDLARIEGIKTGGRAQEISLGIFEKWLSQSADHLISWKLLPIFCHVVNSIDPLRSLVGVLSAKVLRAEEVPLLEWAKAEKQRRTLGKKIRRLEGQIEW